MKTIVDARLRAEAARFSLRFACDDCVHFAHTSSSCAPSCAHGYPLAPRRDALEGTEVLFCKEFELGDAHGG